MLTSHFTFPVDDQAGYRIDDNTFHDFTIFHFSVISLLFSVHATYILGFFSF
jgi:hypothetical protein